MHGTCASALAPARASPLAHLASAASLAVIALNLCWWLIPLSLLAALGRLPSRRLGRWLPRGIEFVYRAAVAVDRWWLQRALGLRFPVCGPRPRAGEHCVVVANHRSWFDVLALQSALVPSGPILTFLIKQELVRVPIVGWICLAMGFPRLTRSRDRRAADAAVILRALAERPAGGSAILTFAEGHRFTAARHRQSGSPYRRLLPPRPGGLRVLFDALPAQTAVYDVTLAYDREEASFWGCLSGGHGDVRLLVRQTTVGSVLAQGTAAWLQDLWTAKDRALCEAAARRRGGTCAEADI
jgi:1-acyl-sn-glycerol-3-phosphate acyltransferase